MDLPLAVALAAILAVPFATSRFLRGRPDFIRDLLRRDGAAWPRGVQEDDDFLWAWDPRNPPPPSWLPPHPPPPPPDPDDEPGLVELVPLHVRVTRR